MSFFNKLFAPKEVQITFDTDDKIAEIASLYAATAFEKKDVDALISGGSLYLDRKDWDIAALLIGLGYTDGERYYAPGDLVEGEAEQMDAVWLYLDSCDPVDDAVLADYKDCVKHLQERRRFDGKPVDQSATANSGAPSPSPKVGVTVVPSDNPLATQALEACLPIKDFKKLSFDDQAKHAAKVLRFSEEYAVYSKQIQEAFRAASERAAEAEEKSRREWQIIFDACPEGSSDRKSAEAFRKTGVSARDAAKLLGIGSEFPAAAAIATATSAAPEAETDDPVADIEAKPADSVEAEAPVVEADEPAVEDIDAESAEETITPLDGEVDDLDSLAAPLIDEEDESEPEYISGGDVIEAVKDILSDQELLKLMRTILANKLYLRNEVVYIIPDYADEASKSELVQAIEQIPASN